jgi:hypothetical protein
MPAADAVGLCSLLRTCVSFKYDSFGRRIYKSSSTATSIYAYDGDNLVEEANASGAVVARYEDTQNIDEPCGALQRRRFCKSLISGWFLYSNQSCCAAPF